MDGFDETDNIMVFAATNLVKRLDNALTRSGRFDKKVYFDPPNFKERKEMYEMYFFLNVADIEVRVKTCFQSVQVWEIF